ncbi:MAG: tandem-95 repeat protein, partial [Gammaproteobacteria bacterium]
RDITITPAANQWGAPTLITLTAFANGQTTTTNFSITVSSVNDAPIVTDDAGSVDEDGTLNGASVLANDSDLHGGAPGENNTPLTAVLAVGPSHGSLSLSGSGTYTYTPDSDYFGADSFTYRAQDALGGLSATATVTITVNSVNDEPSFSASNPATVLEDSGVQSVSGWVSAFNPGPANESGQSVLGYTVDNLSNAALFSVAPSVANDGTLSYTPAANASGSSTFDVVVQDDGGTANGGDDTSAIQTFTITVTAVNDEPSFTAADPAASNEDAGAQSVSGWASFNAGPNEGSQNVLGYTVSNLSNAGLFSTPPAVANDGTLSYTAAANVFGSSTFDVVVQDDGGTANGGDDTSLTQTFTITVNSVNDLPTAGADSYAVDEDTVLNVAAPGILGNDSDPVEGSALTAVLDAGPSHGILTLNANGGFSYTPDADYFGGDSFTYFANDGTDNSAAATVTITVNSINDAPVFEIFPSDIPAMNEDTSLLTINGTALALRVMDPEGDALTVAAVSGNQYLLPNANLGIQGSGNERTIELTLAPDKNSATSIIDSQSGFVTVSVTAFDSHGASVIEDFLIQSVTPVDDAPSFVPGGVQTVAEDAGAQSTTWATSFRYGPNTATDETAQTLVAYTLTPVPGATLTFAVPPSINSSGVLSYTTAANSFGTAAYEVRVIDSGSNVAPNVNTSMPHTLVINVTPVNDPPVADNGSATLAEDGAAAITLTASDVDDAPGVLTYAVVTPPANGSLSGTAPNLTYTPNANFNGADSFTFTASDDEMATSAPATISITVTEVNDVPVAGDDSVADVLEDAPMFSISAATLLGNDGNGGGTDEATQTLSITAVDSAVGGTVALNAGNVEFTPALDFNGAASFVYTVTDNGTTNGLADPQSDTATVSFTITPVNDAPSFAATNPATVSEDAGAQTLSNWASFTAGPANESSQAVLAYTVSGVTNAGLFSAGPSVGTDGTLTYTPAAGISGSSDFTVQVQDNGGTANGGIDLSLTQTFTITVSDVNDQPSFTASSPAAVLEDAGVQTLAAWATFDQGAGDSGQAVLAYNVTGVTNAALFSAGPSVGTDGTLSFTPAINANGTSDFTVTVQDNGGTANGGVDTSVAQTFTITVTAVNDAPGFTIGPNQAPAQGSTGVQTVTGWATDISAGPADEAGQALNFTPAEVTDPNDIVSAVSVAANGTLSYTLNGPAGTATISLTLSDDGGTANGGVDTSPALTFTITTLEPLADLAVSKFAQYAPGNLVVWDVVVENLGPGPVTDARVIDTLPAGISGATWTCAVLSGTASCGVSGSGDIDELVDMNAGSALLFTVTATLTTPDATISNTASVVAPAGVTDNVPGNNSATVVLTVPMFSDGFEGSGMLVQGELKSAAAGVWQAMPLMADDIADRIADFRGQTVASFTSQGQTLQVMARAVDGANEARLLRRDAKGVWTSTAWVTLRDGGVLQLQWLQQGDLLDARVDSLD